MFEKKDEVRIIPEFLELYENMGLKNFTVEKEIDAIMGQSVTVSKIGRITFLDDINAQVDFWDSTPSKFTVRQRHLELVSRAEEREDVAGEPMGAIVDEKTAKDLLLREGVIDEEELMSFEVPDLDTHEPCEYVTSITVPSNGSYTFDLPEGTTVVTPEFTQNHVPKKLDSGKPRMDLIRPEFTLALGEALAYGAEKYDEKIGETPNYLRGDGFNYSRIIASLERHIAQWKMGINIDEESNIDHLALAGANLMFLLTYEKTEKGIDDRVILKKCKK